VVIKKNYEAGGSSSSSSIGESIFETPASQDMSLGAEELD
jgi:hypothetical protein